MTVEQLESVLLYFYNNRKWYIYFEQIKNHFEHQNFTDIELQSMIQKLVKDGYIIEEEQLSKIKDGKTGQIKDTKLHWGWYISYDGMLLIDSLPIKYHWKPYQLLQDEERKRKRNLFIENWPKKYWYIVAIATFIIGGFADIGKEALRRKILPESTQLIQPIQERSDTSMSRKIH